MRHPTAALAALVLLAAAPAVAQARGPSIWVRCDGLPGQGKAEAKQMAKILIPFQVAGLPEGPSDRPAGQGQDGISACTDALADSSVAGADGAGRRANLLRARALHYLEAGDPADALSDIAAARAGVAELGPADPAVERSFGASLSLLEAAVLVRLGRYDEAERLALGVADARPYAVSIQRAAADILAVDPHIAEGEGRVLARLIALDPGAASIVEGRRKDADALATTATDARDARAKALDLDYYAVQAPAMDPLKRTSMFKYGPPISYAKKGFATYAGYDDHAIKGAAQPDAVRWVGFVDAPGRSHAGAEEMLLRRGADLAAAHHAKGFLITRYADTRLDNYATSNTGHVVAGPFPGAFTADMDILYVDPDNLPPELAGQKDRVLSTDAVLAATAWGVK
ncbi:MAG: hypothetical protein JWP35_4166 [Caulobacter sp.]|nr:hypothetical protein [Caulobacter sp.]